MPGIMSLETPSNGYLIGFKPNSTEDAFPALAATTTAPSGGGVFQPTGQAAQIQFYGTDAANEVFNARLIRWDQVGVDSYTKGLTNIVKAANTLWVPTVVWTGVVTLGALTGVNGTLIPATNFFADTITSTGTPATTVSLYSPADDTVAYLQFIHQGATLMQVQIDRTTAASGNALVKFF